MSHKDNQDLRQREIGWSWTEHELFSVFVPLIGPQGLSVYITMTRLIPLVAADPWKYDFGVRRISAWSGMSKSTAAKFLRLICDIGMISETKYLDGRDPSYTLVSLRDLAKVGGNELKRRAGVRVTDTAPYDYIEKNRVQRKRVEQKRQQSQADDGGFEFGEAEDDEDQAVRHTDSRDDELAAAGEDRDAVRQADTVSAQDAKVSAVDSESGHHTDTYVQDESVLKANTPLPPAVRGEIDRDDPDKACPSLPTPGCTIADAGFATSLPAAASWVATMLRITHRRLLPVMEEQLRLWCRSNRSKTLEDAAMLMAKQGRLLHEHAHLLRHNPWGWPKFFTQGHWARPLPYDKRAQDASIGAAPAPNREDLSEEHAAALLRARTFCAANAERVSHPPTADALRAIAARPQLDFDTALDQELEQLQQTLSDAMVAALEPEARAKFDQVVDAEMAPIRKQYADKVTPERMAEMRVTCVRKHLVRDHGMPLLGLFYMPKT